MPRKAKESAPESGRQCKKRGHGVKRITYDYERGAQEHPRVVHKRQTRDDDGRLVWREHLITLESLEAFVRRFPVLCSFTDMRLMAQTMKLIEGVGFVEGTPSTLHEVVFVMQQESTPPAERYEFEDFVERSLKTGEETVLKRIRFDLSINYQALWTIASQYDIDLRDKSMKSGSGWWAHSVRLMARYQWWTFFGTDNWTQRTPNNEHLHEQHELLPEKDNFKNMGYFHLPHYEKLEGSINAALKHHGLQPRKRPFDLSRLVNDPPKQNAALQTALTFKSKTDQAEESAKRQRREEKKAALTPLIKHNVEEKFDDKRR